MYTFFSQMVLGFVVKSYRRRQSCWLVVRCACVLFWC